MYCTHCAKKIDESKIEKKQSSFADVVEVKEGATVAYVCPRCGHLVHADVNEEETKALARAAHAQIQRARNNFSSGLSMSFVGIIGLIIAIIFFVLACKPSNQFQLVTDCAEFYVSMILGAISVILLIAGVVFLVLGIKNSRQNHTLLRDINNRTFVQ